MRQWQAEENASKLMMMRHPYRGLDFFGTVQSVWGLILNYFPGKDTERNDVTNIVETHLNKATGTLQETCAFFINENLFQNPNNFNPNVRKVQIHGEEFYEINQVDKTKLYISIDILLGEGSFGKTYLAKLYESQDSVKDIALKIVSVKEKDSSPAISFLNHLKITRQTPSEIRGFSAIMTSLTNDAVKEAWITSLLYCIDRKYGKTDTDLLLARDFNIDADIDTGRINRHAKLPKIMLSATFEEENGTNVLMAMSKMDINFEKFIKNPSKYPAALKHVPDLLYAFKMYMFGIACTLNALQTGLNFVHGDFHCENAMLVENGGLVYPCIIDFGFASIDVERKRYTFDANTPQTTEFNPSRDLLNMIWSIDAICRDSIGTKEKPGEDYTEVGEAICKWCEAKLIDAGVPEKYDFRQEKMMQQYHEFLNTFNVGGFIHTNSLPAIVDGIQAVFETDSAKTILIDVAMVYSKLDILQKANEIDETWVDMLTEKLNKERYSRYDLRKIDDDETSELFSFVQTVRQQIDEGRKGYYDQVYNDGKVNYNYFRNYMDQYIPQPYWNCYKMSANEIFPMFVPKNFALSIAAELNIKYENTKWMLPLMTFRGMSGVSSKERRKKLMQYCQNPCTNPQYQNS